MGGDGVEVGYLRGKGWVNRERDISEYVYIYVITERFVRKSGLRACLPVRRDRYIRMSTSMRFLFSITLENYLFRCLPLTDSL